MKEVMYDNNRGKRRSERIIRTGFGGLLSAKRSDNTKRSYHNDLHDFFVTMTGTGPSPTNIQKLINQSRFEASLVVIMAVLATIEVVQLLFIRNIMTKLQAVETL
jgi:hypothetical protein